MRTSYSWALLLPLAGCTSLFGQSAGEYSRVGLHGTTKGIVTTADLRTVIRREGASGHEIVCTEPPPDIAKALATAFELAASGKGKVPAPTGTNLIDVEGQGSLNNRSAEQLAQLTGRVPGLLALRDGLFRACEAYGNGTIGSAAYSLILSRYGQVLTTVILADAIHDPSQTTTVIAGQPFLAPSTPVVLGADASDDAKAAAKAAGDAAAAAETAKAAAGKAEAAADAAKKTTGRSADDISTQASTAIAQMSSEYLQLGATGPILLACIGSYDPTLPANKGLEKIRENPALPSTICQEVIRKQADYEAALAIYTLQLRIQAANKGRPAREQMPVPPMPRALTALLQ